MTATQRDGRLVTLRGRIFERSATGVLFAPTIPGHRPRRAEAVWLPTSKVEVGVSDPSYPVDFIIAPRWLAVDYGLVPEGRT
jgi:hypothetical protein